MLTVIELSDVTGNPKAKLEFPHVALGAKVQLNFCLRRKQGGRSEILEVKGIYRVSSQSVGLNAQSSTEQALVVEALGVSPHWRAVKQNPQPRRVLPPLKGVRFVVEG